MKCTQVSEVEELVTGSLDADDALELRRHVEGCADCSVERRMLEAERTLFARRAEVDPGPPPSLAVDMRRMEARLVATRNARPVVASIKHIFARGHFTAACAAALFLSAAFSRSGAGGVVAMTMATTVTAAADAANASSGSSSSVLSSQEDEEPLACIIGELSSADTQPSSFSSSSASSLLASLAGAGRVTEVAACTAPGPRVVASSCDRASSVTCAAFRQ